MNIKRGTAKIINTSANCFSFGLKIRYANNTKPSSKRDKNKFETTRASTKRITTKVPKNKTTPESPSR